MVLFERVSDEPSSVPLDTRPPSPLAASPLDFRYLTEFQAHELEFDYLKSVEIEERVNRVKWLRRWQGSSALSVLTANDKTIKLWKTFEKTIRCLSEFNLQNGSSTLNRVAGAKTGPFVREKPDRGALAIQQRGVNALRLPQVVSTETVLSTKCRRVYAPAHTYHIHSISLSADQETFLSGDDLRVNLWHLDRPDTCFNVVDIKPPSMEDLIEVITTAEFHPTASHLFAYGSSKGAVRLADFRAGAHCDGGSLSFQDTEKSREDSKSFFNEIVQACHDVKFVGSDGNLLLCRDYMNLRLWDIRQEARPLGFYPVHESLRPRLGDLYESDAIFDKFEAVASSDGAHFATGTYSNFFRVVSRAPGNDVLLETSRDPMRRRLAPAANRLPARFVGFGRNPYRSRQAPSASSTLAAAEDALCSDFSAKIRHLSWHPTDNLVAAAACNALYLFYGRDGRITNPW